MYIPDIDIYRQSGILPYKFVDGNIFLLLITSRKGNRWIIPKGIVEPHLTPVESASQEAFEEAGIEGALSREQETLEGRRLPAMGLRQSVALSTLLYQCLLHSERSRRWILIWCHGPPQSCAAANKVGPVTRCELRRGPLSRAMAGSYLFDAHLP